MRRGTYTRLLNEKKKLNHAFRILRANGYIALQDFSCCGTCAGYEIHQMMEQPGAKQKYITYNSQSGDVFRDSEYGAYGDFLYIHFHGVNSEISDAMKEAGITNFSINCGVLKIKLNG